MPLNNPTQLQDLINRITLTNTLDSAEVTAKTRADLFGLLGAEIAEGIDDQTKLQTLITKLNDKKTLFETNLGKQGTIDFTNNNRIVALWEKHIKAKPWNNPHASTNRTSPECTALKTLVTEAFDDFTDHLKKQNSLYPFATPPVYNDVKSKFFG